VRSDVGAATTMDFAARSPSIRDPSRITVVEFLTLEWADLRGWLAAKMFE
jgi:hypothetical protein